MELRPLKIAAGTKLKPPPRGKPCIEAIDPSRAKGTARETAERPWTPDNNNTVDNTTRVIFTLCAHHRLTHRTRRGSWSPRLLVTAGPLGGRGEVFSLSSSASKAPREPTRCRGVEGGRHGLPHPAWGPGSAVAAQGQSGRGGPVWGVQLHWGAQFSSSSLSVSGFHRSSVGGISQWPR